MGIKIHDLKPAPGPSATTASASGAAPPAAAARPPAEA